MDFEIPLDQIREVQLEGGQIYQTVLSHSSARPHLLKRRRFQWVIPGELSRAVSLRVSYFD